MLARVSAFLVWAVVAATAVFWGLRLTAQSPQVPAHAVAIGKTDATQGDLSRLLGATPTAGPAAAPETNSRFQLLGIIAPRPKGEAPATTGVALIAVDGSAARAYSVGAPIDDGLVLQSVSLRTASIGPAEGERSVLLELPALPPPATGSLAAAGGVAPARPATPVVTPKAVMPVAAPVPAAQPAPLSMQRGAAALLR
jgi:general secretion pathway protein C